MCYPREFRSTLNHLSDDRKVSTPELLGPVATVPSGSRCTWPTGLWCNTWVPKSSGVPRTSVGPKEGFPRVPCHLFGKTLTHGLSAVKRVWDTIHYGLQLVVRLFVRVKWRPPPYFTILRRFTIKVINSFSCSVCVKNGTLWLKLLIKIFTFPNGFCTNTYTNTL